MRNTKKSKSKKSKMTKATKANLIAYYMRDMIDTFGNGGQFIFEQVEKDLLRILAK